LLIVDGRWLLGKVAALAICRWFDGAIGGQSVQHKGRHVVLPVAMTNGLRLGVDGSFREKSRTFEAALVIDRFEQKVESIRGCLLPVVDTLRHDLV